MKNVFALAILSICAVSLAQAPVPRSCSEEWSDAAFAAYSLSDSLAGEYAARANVLSLNAEAWGGVAREVARGTGNYRDWACTDQMLRKLSAAVSRIEKDRADIAAQREAAFRVRVDALLTDLLGQK